MTMERQYVVIIIFKASIRLILFIFSGWFFRNLFTFRPGRERKSKGSDEATLRRSDRFSVVEDPAEDVHNTENSYCSPKVSGQEAILDSCVREHGANLRFLSLRACGLSLRGPLRSSR